MKIAVIGYEAEGRAAETYYRAKGHEVEIRDLSLGDDYLENLTGFDLIVRSPLIHPQAIMAKGIDPLKITSATLDVFKYSPAPIIGIVGTKGKGTTATLIAKIMATAGKRVWLGGEIGRPTYEFMPEIRADDIVVLELSSFQLVDLTHSPATSVCVMVAPEHLDWHRSFEAYTEAISHAFSFQKPENRAVYMSGNEAATQIAATSAGEKVPYGATPGASVQDGQISIDGQAIVSVGEVGLLGPHNLDNICAAVTATWELCGKNVALLKQVIVGFSGLDHHLQLVRELAGVEYYDDSFSTTPETAIAAIKSFDKPKLMILGGADKGKTYGELARAVQDGNVIHALLIGDVAPVIAAELRAVGYDHFTIVDWQGMLPLVQLAQKLTEPGDIVLLSTGSDAHGLFHDIADAAVQFTNAVWALV